MHVRLDSGVEQHAAVCAREHGGAGARCPVKRVFEQVLVEPAVPVQRERASGRCGVRGLQVRQHEKWGESVGRAVRVKVDGRHRRGRMVEGDGGGGGGVAGRWVRVGPKLTFRHTCNRDFTTEASTTSDEEMRTIRGSGKGFHTRRWTCSADHLFPITV